jgi:L-fuconolactonase
MAMIRKDFFPEDLEPVLHANGAIGSVAIQADQTEEETKFLLGLAEKHDFIKAVVGWVDLRNEQLAERLDYYSQFPKLKGFRHILQGEEPAFMLQPNFLRGISQLRKYKLTYDILVFPHHLEAALELVRQFPDQPFVIDHIAKPYIKDGKIAGWRESMRDMAALPNVYCKISGMVTEADMRNWKKADFRPYLDATVESFGIDRIMYGSDWPVCLAGGSYADTMDIVKDYFCGFSFDEQQKFFKLNAMSFYNIS